MRPVLRGRPTGDCPLCSRPQQGLEFAECHCRGVRHRTCRFNRLANRSDFLHRQIVHDDDVFTFEHWSKALLHVGKNIGPFIRKVPSSRIGAEPPQSRAARAATLAEWVVRLHRSLDFLDSQEPGPTFV
jgi:hypothetical protein